MYLISALLVLFSSIFVSAGSRQVGEPQKEISAIAWNDQGDRIAIGTSQNTVEIVMADTGDTISVLHGHSLPVVAIDWRPDGLGLATASLDGTVMLWELPDPRSKLTLGPHGEPVNAVMWSFDMRFVVSGIGGVNGFPTLRVWDSQTGELVRTLSPSSVDLIRGDPLRQLILISRVSDVIVFDDGLENETHELSVSPNEVFGDQSVTSIDVATDSSVIAVGYLNGAVRVFSSDSGTLIAETNLQQNAVFEGNVAIRDVAVDTHAQTAFVLSDSGDLAVWSFSEPRSVPMLLARSLGRQGVFSPYGGRLAYAKPTSAKSDSDAQVAALTSIMDVIVIEPNFERVLRLASACRRDAADSLAAGSVLSDSVLAALTDAALPAFIAQVEALPEGAIPPACKADLLAVARAVVETGEG